MEAITHWVNYHFVNMAQLHKANMGFHII